VSNFWIKLLDVRTNKACKVYKPKKKERREREGDAVFLIYLKSKNVLSLNFRPQSMCVGEGHLAACGSGGELVIILLDNCEVYKFLNVTWGCNYFVTGYV
jgi:hypothetical protein